MYAPNWLGDAVMALPAIGDLLATFGDDAVDVYAAPVPASLYRRVEPPFRLVELTGAGRLRRLGRAVPRLRRARYDLAVVFPPSFSSALLVWLGGVRARVGYRAECRSPLLSASPARPSRGAMHLSEEYRRLAQEAARAIGRSAARAEGVRRVRPATEDRTAARALVGGVPRPRIALAPGAAYGETKRWPAERFGALAARLAARGASIFVTGAGADRPAADAVVRSGAGRARNVTGDTDLGTAAALFAEMNLVVTNDSGAMHLAAAVGVPIVAIFGSTSPAWTAPLGDRTRIIARDEPCAPCFARTCGIGTVCLTRIEVDEVYRACDELLEEAEAHRRP